METITLKIKNCQFTSRIDRFIELHLGAAQNYSRGRKWRHFQHPWIKLKLEWGSFESTTPVNRLQLIQRDVEITAALLSGTSGVQRT